MAGLTDKKIEKLLPREKPYDVAIDNKGFRLRVMGSEESPVRTFVLLTRYPGSQNPTRRAVGSFPSMRLDEAWAEVVRWRQQIKLGIDPTAEAEERRAEQERKREAASRIVTIGSLVEAFLKAREQHFSPAWRVEATRYLGKSLEPLHAVPAEELSRSHIAAALDLVETQSGATSADRAKDALSSLLAWVVERGYRDVNPAIGIRRRVSTTSRERVLNERELALVWNALPSGDYGSILKLLTLTGQRRNEIADLEWKEIDFDKAQIELPGGRTKNGRAHIVPLSAEALEILRTQPRYPGRALVFGAGKSGFKGWSAAKIRLDAKLPDMPAWRLHDLRRSVVTHLNERGFAAPHVCEAVINHISGYKAGIAGTYNKALYLPERRAALQAWAAHLLSVVRNSNSAT